MWQNTIISWALLWGINLFLLQHILLLPDGKVHAYILDVGQGDASIIVSPSGKQIIVDGGPDLTLLSHLGQRLPFFDRTIELLILTHPNQDHITAIPQLLQTYTIRSVLLSHTQSSLPTYQQILGNISTKGMRVLTPDPTVDIDMGDGLILDIIWPIENVWKGMWENITNDDVNNRSVVFRAMKGKKNILFTGDVGKDGERELLKSGVKINTAVLKVAHHGSHTSTSTGFLLASSPQRAIISVGKNNRYGHPHPHIISRLLHFGTTITTTAGGGTIIEEF